MTLAAAYRRAHAYPEAIVAFERLAGNYPDNEEAIAALGELYREIGDPVTAVRWLEQYPPDGKNRAAVLLILAQLAEDADDPVRSRYYLQKSFEKDTTKQWTYYRFVELDRKTGNLLLALEEAEEGVRRFPRFAEMALLAGTIAYKLENFDKARRYFEIARDNGGSRGIVGLENLRNRLRDQ